VEEEPVGDELEATLHREHRGEEVVKQAQGLTQKKGFGSKLCHRFGPQNT